LKLTFECKVSRDPHFSNAWHIPTTTTLLSELFLVETGIEECLREMPLPDLACDTSLPFRSFWEGGQANRLSSQHFPTGLQLQSKHPKQDSKQGSKQTVKRKATYSQAKGEPCWTKEESEAKEET
jgi:hypothetical protein